MNQFLIYKINVLFKLRKLIDVIFVLRLVLVFRGLIIFSSKREHLLSVLLRLEYISLGIFIIFLGSLIVRDLFYSLYYLVFTACEGALGLSILILINRVYGGDYFKTFNSYV